MNRLKISNSKFIKNINSTVRKAGFKLQKHSPEILVVVGVVGTVTSAVLACRATIKAKDVVAKAKEDLDVIHDCAANEDFADEYTQEDAKKDLVIAYTQAGVDLIKLYAPAVIIGGLSIGCMLVSNNILRKRNVSLAAAYVTLDRSFKEYRKRVAEKLGEEGEKDIRYGLKEIENIVVDEDGKEKKKKEKIKVVDKDSLGDYSFLFDESNPYWQKSGDFNRMFLLSNQQYANDLLRANRIVFLNDVLERLGYEKTKAGQIVGWVYNEESPNGDNYIDFGICEAYRKQEREFDLGKATGELFGSERYERSIILDFNVDGNVWELMEK